MLEVTCALIIKDGSVLTAQNGFNSDHALQWEFPGGKIHLNESARDCIVREIREELNVRISIEKELVSVEHDYGIKKIRLIPFVCTIYSGEIKLNEHRAFNWTTFGELPKTNLCEADLKMILHPENQELLKEYARK